MFSRETLLRLRGTRAGLAHDDFLGKAQIGLGAFGLDVIMKDGLAEAGGLGKPHGAGDDRFKDLIGEATVHFVLHLPRQAVAPENPFIKKGIVSRETDTLPLPFSRRCHTSRQGKTKRE